MIQALSADRADEPLYVWALPRRTKSSQKFTDFEAFGLRTEGRTVNAVAVAEQEPWTLVPRESLQELCCGPLGGRKFGDIEVNNAPAIMGQNRERITHKIRSDPRSRSRFLLVLCRTTS